MYYFRQQKRQKKTKREHKTYKNIKIRNPTVPTI